MTKLTSRDWTWFAAVTALDAVLLAAMTVWVLVDTLTGDPASSWWWVAFGVAVTSGAVAASLWFRRRAVQVKSGGAA